MKTFIHQLTTVFLLLALFSTSGFAQDDVYYNPNGYDKTNSSDYSTSETDEEGNTTINNYYYDDEDDDWEYSRRIRRFYNHCGTWDYYNPYYTSSYYYDPFDWCWGRPTIV